MHSHQSRLQPPTSKPYLCQMNWPKHLCFLLFCCTTFVGWSTDIPAGNVSGVWTAANSPYVVQGNLRVPAGESLTIEAGVEVQFAANYFVRVLGNFQALGAAGDSVLLHNPNPGGYWHGFKLDSLDAASDTARFSHCIFTTLKNSANSIVNTNKVVFEDSRLHHNTQLYVGTILMADANPIIRRCKFQNNTSSSGSEGTSIYISDSSPLIEDCEFTNNYATYNGAGLAMYRYDVWTSPIIRNCLFEGNTALGGCAVIIHSNVTATFENNTFRNNSGTYDGGAIWVGYIQADTLHFRNNVFEENHAVSDGGALYIVNSKVKFDGDTFNGNTANSLGGGIYAYDECQLTFEGCEFKNNDGSQGGAMHISESSAKINRCNFHNNTATAAGALWMTYYTTGYVSNSIFANNSANSGGAVRLVQYSHIPFSNCTFTNNKAVNSGGAMSLYHDSDPQIRNCIFWGNEAETGPTLAVQDYIWHTCEADFAYGIVQGGEASMSLGTSTLNGYSNISEEDPLFLFPTFLAGADEDASFSNWNFNIENSPCLNTGTPDPSALEIGVLDIAGNARWQGEFIDLGAYEGGGEVIPVTITSQSEGGMFCDADDTMLFVEAEGLGMLIYQWYLNGNLLGEANTNFFQPTESGTYQCVVTGFDSNAVSELMDVALAVPMSLELLSESLACFGSSDGYVEILVEGGQAPYGFELVGVEENGSGVFEELEAGNYEVIVTDASLCIANGTFTIDSPSELAIEITNVIEPTCDTCSDGSFEIIALGGVPPYIYEVSGLELGFSPFVNEAAPGDYNICITDGNGCVVCNLFALEEDGFPQEIDLDGNGVITIDDLLTFIANYGCTGVDCVGDLNGDLVVNVADLMIFLGLF
jgi:parallel beta-helix repeat protein/predicted outer membrane repeat protein